MGNWSPTNPLTELSSHADVTRKEGRSGYIKVRQAFRISFQGFHPSAPTHKGCSRRNPKGLLKGDHESQASCEETRVSYEGLHGQCLQIHKLKNCSQFKDSSEIAVVKIHLVLGRKRLLPFSLALHLHNAHTARLCHKKVWFKLWKAVSDEKGKICLSTLFSSTVFKNDSW